MLPEAIAPPALEPETEEEADIFASSLLSLFDHFVPSFGGPLQLYHYVSPASISAPEVKLSVRIPPHQQTTIFAHYQWMSGIRMADKIAAGEVEVQGKVVLELGAGTGLPGLLAVRQGATRCVLSDYDDETMLDNIRFNIKQLPAELQSLLVAAGHSWGEDVSSLLSLSESRKGFSLILLADTLWSSSSHASLLQSLVQLLARTRDSTIQIVAGLHTGRESVRAFLRKAMEVGLEMKGEWIEVGHDGGRRDWGWNAGEEEEEGGERNKWVVEGRLGWSEVELGSNAFMEEEEVQAQERGDPVFQASLSLSLHHFVRLMSRSYSNSSFYDQPRRRISVSTASGSGSSTYSSEKHSSSGESSDFYERPVYEKNKDRKKGLLWIVVALVLVALIGGGVGTAFWVKNSARMSSGVSSQFDNAGGVSSVEGVSTDDGGGTSSSFDALPTLVSDSSDPTSTPVLVAVTPISTSSARSIISTSTTSTSSKSTSTVSSTSSSSAFATYTTRRDTPSTSSTNAIAYSISTHAHPPPASTPIQSPSPAPSTNASTPRSPPSVAPPAPSPSSAPPAPPPASDPTQQSYLSAHNSFRATHHASPLSWDSQLAAAASKWGTHCVFEHSGGSLLPTSYGENLYASSGIQKDASIGVQAWNDEEKDYDYDIPGFGESTGHFTQVVWKGSERVGCALVNCKLAIFSTTQDSTFSVCVYSPAGNVVSSDNGYFRSNVLRP